MSEKIELVEHLICNIKKFKYHDKSYLFLFLFLNTVVLGLIYFFRYLFNLPNFISNHSYYNIFYSKTFNLKNTYVINLLNNLLTLDIFRGYRFVFLLICSYFSVMLLYFILRKLKVKKSVFFSTMLFSIIIPSYVFVFISLNRFIIILPLYLLFVYLLIDLNKIKLFFIFIIMGLLLYFDIGLFYFNIFTLFLFYLHNKFKENKTKVTKGFLLKKDFYFIWLFFLNLGLYFSFRNIFEFSFFQYKQGVNTLISEIGSLYGVTIPIIILFLIGVFIFAKSKKGKVYLLLYFFICLFIYFNSIYIILFNYLIVFYASKFIDVLLNYRWNSFVLKYLTLAIILFSILLTSGSYMNRMIRAEPTEITVKSFEIFESNCKNVLINVDKAYYLNFFTNCNSYIEPYNELDKYSDFNFVLFSRNINSVERFFYENNIDYIYVDDASMLNFYTGISFVLKNSKAFREIYNYNGILIYKYENIRFV